MYARIYILLVTKFVFPLVFAFGLLACGYPFIPLKLPSFRLKFSLTHDPHSYNYNLLCHVFVSIVFFLF